MNSTQRQVVVELHTKLQLPYEWKALMSLVLSAQMCPTYVLLLILTLLCKLHQYICHTLHESIKPWKAIRLSCSL